MSDFAAELLNTATNAYFDGSKDALTALLNAIDTDDGEVLSAADTRTIVVGLLEQVEFERNRAITAPSDPS